MGLWTSFWTTLRISFFSCKNGNNTYSAKLLWEFKSTAWCSNFISFSSREQHMMLCPGGIKNQRVYLESWRIGREPERYGFFFLLVMVSEEIQTYFLSFKQPKKMVQLGDGKSNLNTICKPNFQAEFESNTKQNSILLLEDYLLSTIIRH